MAEITCSKCGEKKLAGKQRYEKLKTKFGSEANLKMKYLCRDCRKPATKSTQKTTQ